MKKTDSMPAKANTLIHAISDPEGAVVPEHSFSW